MHMSTVGRMISCYSCHLGEAVQSYMRSFFLKRGIQMIPNKLDLASTQLPHSVHHFLNVLNNTRLIHSSFPFCTMLHKQCGM